MMKVIILSLMSFAAVALLLDGFRVFDVPDNFV